jgi:hypothetical protein
MPREGIREYWHVSQGNYRRENIKVAEGPIELRRRVPEERQ